MKTELDESTSPRLFDYKTGEQIRPASPDELRASEDAAARDGGCGVIVVEGRSCFAQ